MPSTTKRCPSCGICPTPRDFSCFWGPSAEDAQASTCLRCRGGKYDYTSLHNSIVGTKKEVLLVPIRKMAGVHVDDIQRWWVPQTLREDRDKVINLDTYYCTVFLTDGEDRFWRMVGFPWNKTTPLTREQLLRSYTGEWKWWGHAKGVEST